MTTLNGQPKLQTVGIFKKKSCFNGLWMVFYCMPKGIKWFCRQLFGLVMSKGYNGSLFVSRNQYLLPMGIEENYLGNEEM